DRVVRRTIGAVKRHADKTLLRHILAAHVELNRAVGEVDARQERNPITQRFAQTDALSGAVDETACGAVEELQTLRIGKSAEIWRDRFRLTGDAGKLREAPRTGKRRNYELTSLHSSLRSRPVTCVSGIVTNPHFIAESNPRRAHLAREYGLS